MTDGVESMTNDAMSFRDRMTSQTDKTERKMMFEVIKRRKYNVLMTLNFHSCSLSEDEMRDRLYKIERAINRYLFDGHALSVMNRPHLFRYIARPEIDSCGVRHYHMLAFVPPHLEGVFFREDDPLAHHCSRKIADIVRGIGGNKSTLHIDKVNPTQHDQWTYWEYGYKDTYKGYFEEDYVVAQSEKHYHEL